MQTIFSTGTSTRFSTIFSTGTLTTFSISTGTFFFMTLTLGLAVLGIGLLVSSVMLSHAQDFGAAGANGVDFLVRHVFSVHLPASAIGIEANPLVHHGWFRVTDRKVNFLIAVIDQTDVTTGFILAQYFCGGCTDRHVVGTSPLKLEVAHNYPSPAFLNMNVTSV